jgi:hypothetical protein
MLGQCQRQSELGTLAPGQRACPLVKRNAQAVQPLPHRHPVPAGIEVRPEADVVLGGETPVQGDFLREEADVGQEGQVLSGRAAEHGDPAASRPGQPGKQPQQRCLARTVRADER